MRKGRKWCIYICILRGRVGVVCAYIYSSPAEGVKVLSPHFLLQFVSLNQLPGLQRNACLKYNNAQIAINYGEITIKKTI